MKDFTKAQAKQWVAQELAKHTTAESKARRAATEAEMIAKGDRFNLPNSFQAHKDLHAALVARV
jgi:hypothetical protein